MAGLGRALQNPPIEDNYRKGGIADGIIWCNR